MKPKYLRIYLIIAGTIGVVVFIGLFNRSDSSSAKWKDLEINGQVNDFVHIGKSIFLEIDSMYIEVLYNPYFKKNNPIGCMFTKNKGREYYSIICDVKSADTISSSKGGVVDDKIWLRRIDIALQKKESQMNRE